METDNLRARPEYVIPSRDPAVGYETMSGPITLLVAYWCSIWPFYLTSDVYAE